jgi:hypothetical protein
MADPSPLLIAAREAGLRGKAFELLAMAAACLPRGEYLPLAYYASAADVTPEAAANVIGALVDGGWVNWKRTQAIRDGKKRDIRLYALAVRP